jgi:hypothetical protein
MGSLRQDIQPVAEDNASPKLNLCKIHESHAKQIVIDQKL